MKIKSEKYELIKRAKFRTIVISGKPVPPNFHQLYLHGVSSFANRYKKS